MNKKRANSANGRGKNSMKKSCGKCSNSKKDKKSLNDWSQVLGQINSVTERVKQLCSTQKSWKNKPLSTAYITPFQYQEQHFSTPHRQLIYREPTKSNYETPPKKITPQCNSKCHQMMAECNKLNELNQKLMAEKQFLEKRLFFQSKEKKQLRWKLERQIGNRSHCAVAKYDSNMGEFNSFNLFPPSQPQPSSSKTSTVTAKKFSPLKQRNWKEDRIPRASFKSKTSKGESRTDSLLIDLSSNNNSKVDENYNKTRKQRFSFQKMMKEISLEKKLDNLVQQSKIERNMDRKRQIRKQMRNVAQEMKEIRLR